MTPCNCETLGQWSRNLTDQEIRELLAKPDKIAEIRDNLSSLLCVCQETDVGGRVLEEVAQRLRTWGVNPAPWVGRINEFADHCRSVMGTAEHVEARAEQANKRCYFGINYCRDVFAGAKDSTSKDDST